MRYGAQKHFWKQALYSNLKYILQGYVHSYRHITNTSEWGREWMEGQRMKKEKTTKTYPVTRQATHTLFPPTDKYLPPFGGLCEDGRRGRRQNWTQITTSSKEKHTSLFSSATYVVPDTIVTLVSLSLEGTEFGSLFHCGRYLVLYSIPTSLFPWEMDPNWSRQSGCGIPLES